MAEKKSYIYEIIVDTKAGTASVNGTTIALDKLGAKFRQINKEIEEFHGGMKKGTDKTGLAGAAVVELGRTISDANYGLTAMANNISQLSTLFVTLIATTGNLRNAIQAMKAAFMGPLGIIVVFQIAVAVMEHFAIKAKETKGEVDELTKSLDEQRKSLALLSETYFDSFFAAEGEDALRALRKEFKEFDNAYGDLSDTEKKDLLLVNQLIDDYKILLNVRRNIALLEGKLGEDGVSGVQKIIMEKELVALKIQEAKLALQFEKQKKTKAKGGKDDDDPFVRDQISGVKTIDDEVAKYAIELDAFKKIGEMKIDIQSTSNKKMLEDLDIQKHLEISKERKAALAKKAIWKSEADQRVEALAFMGDALQSFGQVLGDETEAGKFVAAAGAIISTFSAVTKALDTPGLGLARIPYAISVGAFGLAQVAQIYKVNTRGKNSTSGSTGTGATEYNPSFNVVGGSRIDQLNDTIRGELGKPARAYVTTKDIRSSQELERNIIGQGTVTG